MLAGDMVLITLFIVTPSIYISWIIQTARDAPMGIQMRNATRLQAGKKNPKQKTAMKETQKKAITSFVVC